MLKNSGKELASFFALILLTIIVSVFFSQNFISVAYYVGLLVAYSKSKNESFWLAFFFTSTDGFFGFLGLYSTVLNLIPGLPGIELAQIYILIAIYKIWKSKVKVKVFYGKWTKVMFFYVMILFMTGMFNGLKGDLNIFFRVFKLILPLAMFYTTPRLFTSFKQYASLFNILFFVFLFAFVAQIFTIFTGFSPAANFKAIEQTELEVGRNLRAFYNPTITMICLCGSLFFLSIPKQKFFSNVFLNTVVILCFGMAFLSGTRGYIIGFALTIVSFNILVNKLEAKKLFFLVVMFVLVFSVAMSFERINKQIMFSLERTLTLESLAKGDKTADGTLVRLDERGPVVMAEWEKSPFIGWGFSNVFFEKMDGHVGNQTVLLHSGVIGLGLLLSFMGFVCLRLWALRSRFYSYNPYRKGGTVIVLYLGGWFFIHSTSHQQFAFCGLPLDIFPQATLLALANCIINYKPDAIQQDTNPVS